MKNTTAIYPGSFDPVTVGHLDIIRRAASLFDNLIVVVMTNAKKAPSFTVSERVDMLKKTVADIPNVKIDSYEGLLADYAKKTKADVIIRGLRAVSDFEYEFQMALTNKKLYPDTETLFLTTSAENMYLSSSIVKQIGSMGGNIRGFVPDVIHDFIIKRLYGKDE
ncbi:MAG: pantetheine-phosphate adenylyltransferase [bacterium]|nr:pantetheine-phosphate adenylyltransferase [bacterium]